MLSPSMLSCDVAVVGGGPGGIYAGLRVANSTNESVCILEAKSRLGGRVHTLRGLGSKADLTVDVGAYRFARRLTLDNQDTTCV
jgi:monoamine oxidase